MNPPNAAASIADALARIASALRVPVLVLALLALLVCAWELGRFLAEAFSRVRAGRKRLRGLVAATVESPERAGVLAAEAPGKHAAQALHDIALASRSGQAGAVERALADYELAVQRTLERTRILVRAGPALGLMGTLIPLAPGLAALGRGETSTLASDLRTAFAATTIGLLVGTVAFAITLVRTRMYAEDLADLERATTTAPRRDRPASSISPTATLPDNVQAASQPSAAGGTG
jgi:biopolymer transport protein ExbB/TolQ